MKTQSFTLISLAAAFILQLPAGSDATPGLDQLNNPDPPSITARQEPVVLPPGTKAFYDIPYIENGHERQKLDLFLPPGSNVSPLAVFIHGGGFSGGDKNLINKGELHELLNAGIAVASLNYRFYRDAPLPAAFEDCECAIRFLRLRAQEWNFDPSRLGVFGGSAGAQISMYLAFHGNLNNSQGTDPASRLSTRFICVATTGGQITLDHDWWLKHVPECDITRTDVRIEFGVETFEETIPKINAIAAINLLSGDDPPIFMSYGMAPGQPYPTDPKTANNWKFHHVVHGIELKKLADSLGVECHLKYPGAVTRYRSISEFFSAKLLSPGNKK